MRFFLKIFLCFIFIVFSSNVAAQVYKSDAIVSFYAGDFHGKRTSNGEYFDMNAMTCASKNFPFDSILKVTNLANAKSVQVRVNDRGPFVPNRELDLSLAAAKKLDMIKAGTIHAKIEIVKLGPDTNLSRQTASKADKIMQKRFGVKVPKISAETFETLKKALSEKLEAGTYWDFQIASFSTRENAVEFAKKLTRQGFSNIIFQKNTKKSIYRVVIKGVRAEDVPKIEEKLNANGYNQYIIKKRNPEK